MPAARPRILRRKSVAIGEARAHSRYCNKGRSIALRLRDSYPFSSDRIGHHLLDCRLSSSSSSYSLPGFSAARATDRAIFAPFPFSPPFLQLAPEKYLLSDFNCRTSPRFFRCRAVSEETVSKSNLRNSLSIDTDSSRLNMILSHVVFGIISLLRQSSFETRLCKYCSRQEQLQHVDLKERRT